MKNSWTDHLLIKYLFIFKVQHFEIGLLKVISINKLKSKLIYLKYLGGKRYFNVGIQLKSLLKEDVIEAEMTFNCHRGSALIISK